jgi:hypothetical protein
MAHDAKIIMLARRATVDDPALAVFGLKPHELLISASAHRSIDYSDLVGLQLGVIKLDQIGAANGMSLVINDC